MALLSATLSLAGCTAASAGASREADVLARVGELAAAFEAADADRLAALIGPDYVHTNTGGSVLDAGEWLAYVRRRRLELTTGTLRLEHYRNQDLAVRMHGDTAIVTGCNLTSGEHSGVRFARALRFTQVWHSGGTEWRRVAYHDTLAADDTPGCETDASAGAETGAPPAVRPR